VHFTLNLGTLVVAKTRDDECEFQQRQRSTERIKSCVNRFYHVATHIERSLRCHWLHQPEIDVAIWAWRDPRIEIFAEQHLQFATR
jgi:hypothetical protein